ncbi:MAG: prephenate dehydratase [Crenarchaeota archaeon]|nr:prephenate dehydratase [Thermoproteota archaeon]
MGKKTCPKQFLAYLGPAGTYCEEAALSYPGPQLLRQALGSIGEVFEAVRQGVAEKGVVPLENSITGTVNSTLDLLAGEELLQIEAELIIPVQHNLLVPRKTDLSKITAVVSHPQALAQCQQFLDNALPQVKCLSASSTAEAARMIACGEPLWFNSDSPGAAIASGRAAETYGLKIAAANINDVPRNHTRFVVISQRDALPTGRDKTSLVFALAHHPGSLLKALTTLAAAGINLTKIESRPSKRSLGEYWFFVDIEGHHQDFQVENALGQLFKQTVWHRLLGSYPVADEEKMCISE